MDNFMQSKGQRTIWTGRLAPSPTGALHLGNARTFLLAWLSIRHRGGRIILRIEDIDSPRVKSWARQATLDDLRWLGLNWDCGPEDEQISDSNSHAGSDANNDFSHRPKSSGKSLNTPKASPYVQSARLAIYQPYLESLIATERVYPCDCSRSEVEASASAPHEALEGPVYAGACRHRSARDAAQLDPADFAWRFRSSQSTIQWRDELSGLQSANVGAQLGDFIVAKGTGTPAYQLAVVIDDHLMGVSEVVRGDDLAPSTFRQVDLLQTFGWPIPNYLHVPLMIGEDGRRLAKRHGDTRLSWFRRSGYSPEALIGYLAWSAGLITHPNPCRPSDLIPHWNPQRLHRHPFIVKKVSGTFLAG